MKDERLVYILAQMVATRFGYTVGESVPNHYGYRKPGDVGRFGAYTTEAGAWLEAARSIVEQAEWAGIHALIEEHAAK